MSLPSARFAIVARTIGATWLTTGKTHIALGLGLAACQKGLSVGFTTAAAVRQCLSDHWRSIGSLHELMEARDERRLLRLQKQMVGYKLLIIDELGFVPLSKTGAELLFELISQRYERGATLITSNLPFDEWTETFGSERLTGEGRADSAAHRDPKAPQATHAPCQDPSRVGRRIEHPRGNDREHARQKLDMNKPAGTKLNRRPVAATQTGKLRRHGPDTAPPEGSPLGTPMRGAHSKPIDTGGSGLLMQTD
ncbi:hypothetical protein U879_09025 [Defluviimonas sp. 20V17]|uniref:IstB-like ATP binding protein n=1 Tax=Allgaiera indica TaxID=765699 RepID=A0AAN4UWL9_9RHOB|nr:hypothetical protein U879_09025 [Defluviimonas sp. 20V17]GHE06351.1 hypothetical protein GCM10008024_40400 [Allgaiera indica]SDX99930.1 IstB-like ATP binding protein [Allgaiera indica]